jgi:hypothetical protein
MKCLFPLFRITVACVALAIPSAILAQQIALNNDMPTAPSVSPASPLTTLNRPASPAPAIPAWESKADRWLDLNTFTYGARYRSVFDNNGAHAFNQGQQRLIADGKFKFDEQGRYGIGFHLSSGRYFNWAYADFVGGGQSQFVANTEASMTPLQLFYMNFLPFPNGFLNSGGGQLYLRQVYLTAEPVRGIEFQFGGIGIDHGVNTEATSYDDDGYMTGERVTVKRPKQLWLSEVSYTRGFVGDPYKPNFFARGQTLSKSNYEQYLARKDFGKRVSVSADYTWTAPADIIPGYGYVLKTMREGILADVHESKVFDTARFEAYQKLNGGVFASGANDVLIYFSPTKGFALTVNRSIKKRFSVDAGVSDIDLSYGEYLGNLYPQVVDLGLAANGDQYGLGKRYFVRPTIPLTKYASLTGAYNHLFDTNPISNGLTVDFWNKQYLTAGFTIDAKKLFFHSPAVH